MDALFNLLASYLNRPEVGTAIGVFAALTMLLFLVLSILWAILPFAVFGTKKRLDEIAGELQKANTWLEALVIENQKMNSWLSEIMSENKRTTAWLSEMITEMKSPEAPQPSIESSPAPVAPPSEKRRHPRLDFQCTGMLMGKEAVITDLSMGGLFVELDEIPELLKVGQVSNIDLDLPTENESVRMKVKIVSKNERGVGCKYIDLSAKNRKAIENCFEEFKNTLPISNQDDA